MTRSPAVEALFAEHLSDLEHGGKGLLEELCSRHPEHAPRLRSMESERIRFQDLFGPVPEDPAPSEAVGAIGTRSPDFLVRLLERLELPRTPEERYELRGRIGAGGMGIVRRVLDRDLRRELVMKTLRQPGMARPDRPGFDAVKVGRFIDEAQITGQLEHPGIVPVHELGVDAEGEPYYTMRRIEGCTLEEAVELVASGEKPEWSTSRLLSLFLRACEAVAYAHGRGVVHRDLTPKNILVGELGQAYVVDWGLARILPRVAGYVPRPESADGVHSDRQEHLDERAESPLRTADGRTVGTPYYMSPEQAEGRLSDMNERSDVYAAGAVLYHLLSGKPPYALETKGRDTHELLAWIRDHPPQHLEQVRSGLAPELIAIATKAMERAPSRRYADMGELTTDLRNFLDGRVVTAYESGAWAEFKKWVRRNRTVAAMSGVVLSTLVFGLLSSRYFANETRAALERSDESLGLAGRTGLRLASSLLANGDVDSAMQGLAATPRDLRGFEWGHLRLAAQPALVTVDAHDGPTTSLSASLVDDLIMSVGGDGFLRQWDAWTGEELAEPIALGAAAGTDVALHPRGELCVTVSENGDVCVSDFTISPNPLARTRVEGDQPRLDRVCWVSDSRFVTGGQDGHVRVWDLRSGSIELVRSWQAHWRELRAMSVLSNGRLVTASVKNVRDRSSLVRLWDLESGLKLHEEVIEGSDHVLDLSLSPDGSQVALARTDGGLEFRSTRDLSLLIRLPGAHKEAVTAVAFSHDGRFVATGSYDRSVRLWDPRTGQRLRTFGGHRGALQRLVFTPDDRKLVSVARDGTARTWSLDQEAGCSSLDGGYVLGAVAVSPDGSLVASGGDDFTVRLYDPELGLGAATLRGHSDRINDITFDRGGTSLISVSADDTVAVWDVARRKMILRYHGGPEDLEAVVADPLGSRDLAFFTAGRDGRLLAWSLDAPEPRVWHQEATWLRSVAWSNDGQRIACGTKSGDILLFHRSGELELRVGVHQAAVHRLDFHPTAPLLASGCQDGTIGLLDFEAGATQFLEGHRLAVYGVAFSPRGDRLATASYDLSARIWDWKLGTVLLEMQHHDRSLTDLAWFPSGEKMVTTGLDRRVQIWESTRSPERNERRRSAWRLTTRLEPLVDRLFLNSVGLADVHAALAIEDLEPLERIVAEYLADFQGDDPERLLRQARQVLTSPDEDDDAYFLALAKVELALDVHPRILNGHALRAAALLRTGAPKEALARLEDPGRVTLQMAAILHAFRALALMETGAVELAWKALEDFRAGLGDSPSEELHLLLVEVETRLGS